jgi:hypothetical protein
MQDTEKLLQAFKELSVEEKQKKLLAIFDFAKDKFDFSETAINYLSSNTLPEELVMIKLYEFILHATASAKQRIQKRQEEVKNNFKTQEKIAENRDAEEADKLLDLIDLL